jgi:PHS family inorganic phosphate transporter-like MFS transporter
MMGAVFAMQGFGQLGGALVMLCLVSGFKGKLEKATKYTTCVGECQVAVDQMWRALIGIGVVPACIALYYRLTIPETPRYTFDVARDVEKANEDVKQYVSGKTGEGKPDETLQLQARQQSEAQLEVPKASWSDFFRFYGKLRNGKILFGTTMSWLFLDVSAIPWANSACRSFCMYRLPSMVWVLTRLPSSQLLATVLVQLSTTFSTTLPLVTAS